jgi:2-methylcitrate dehydratase PrpD
MTKNAPSPQHAPTFTRRAAEFASPLTMAAVPEEVRSKACACVLYGLGIGLASLDQNTAALAMQAAMELEGEPADPRSGATIFATGRRGSIPAAAFANSVLLHSRCQEDTFGTAHLGIAVLPVAIALLEAGRTRIEDFMPAVVAGYEVAGAIEAALGPGTVAAGLRGTPLYGTIAAAATAARAIKLPVDRYDAALANAFAFTGGIQQPIPDGTDEWRYQAGICVQNGLMAAFLAAAGSVSSSNAVEGRQGFARAYARRDAEIPPTFDGQWRLPDVTFKPYPVCAHNQTPALVCAAIHRAIAAGDIAAVKLRINPWMTPGMDNRGPFSRTAETLMSTYFCCASVLQHGSVTMTQLGRFDDAEVAALIPRIELVPDPAVSFPSAIAHVTTHAGEQVTFTEERVFSDFSLDIADVSRELRRIAAEEGLPLASIEHLEDFVARLAAGSARDALLVSRAFGIARGIPQDVPA